MSFPTCDPHIWRAGEDDLSDEEKPRIKRPRHSLSEYSKRYDSPLLRGTLSSVETTLTVGSEASNGEDPLLKSFLDQYRQDVSELKKLEGDIQQWSRAKDKITKLKKGKKDLKRIRDGKVKDAEMQRSMWEGKVNDLTEKRDTLKAEEDRLEEEVRQCVQAKAPRAASLQGNVVDMEQHRRELERDLERYQSLAQRENNAFYAKKEALAKEKRVLQDKVFELGGILPEEIEAEG